LPKTPCQKPLERVYLDSIGYVVRATNDNTGDKCEVSSVINR